MVNYAYSYFDSTFSYGYDDSLQRKHAVYYGNKFHQSHSGIWYWDYDSRSTRSTTSSACSPTTTPTPTRLGATRWVEDEENFDFDGIGNREDVTFTDTPGGATPPTVTTTDYDVNALNQYDAIGGTSRPTPHHDDDGNLIDDGSKEYVWDAENRLVEVIDAATSNTVATYGYDYMGRRVRKTTTASAPQGATDTIFAYDGWNLIAEWDVSGTPALLRTYAWGLDLSGTLQGAGGVGGLMAITRHDLSPAQTWYYNYDGNGNVSELVNSASYVYAHYEYSPFGKAVEKTYSWADGNPFRFSTKYFDEETGFYYYGYRYYDPEHGRWASRDPIGEQGGLNLYGFVGNDGVGLFDPDGRCKTKVTCADAWGLNLLDFTVSIGKIVNLDFTFGIEMVFNCRSKDKAAFLYYGKYWGVYGLSGWSIGGSFVPVPFSVTVSKLVNSIYNLPSAKDYSGDFRSVTGQINYGIGVGGQFFTTPTGQENLETIGNVGGETWGWGAGLVVGTPGISGGYHRTYYKIVGGISKMTSGEVSSLCDCGGSSGSSGSLTVEDMYDRVKSRGTEWGRDLDSEIKGSVESTVGGTLGRKVREAIGNRRVVE
ncbi:MAG: RHS repeat-associated core domain-containing protein [Verrucomicrobiales bacterium]